MATTEISQPQDDAALDCWRCGTGLVLFNDLAGLGDLWYCRGCTGWFRTDAAARLIPVPAPDSLIRQVRPPAISHWREDEAAAAKGGPYRLEKWCRGWAGEIVPALLQWPRARPVTLACWSAGLALLLLVAIVWYRTPSAEVAAQRRPLPAALEDRAVMLADAWLAKDLRRMLRLTDPARDRELRGWLMFTPPPSGSRKAAAKESKIKVVSVDRPEKGLAAVTLQLEGADEFPSDLKIPLTQTWTCRAGQWYFLPRGVATVRR